MTLCITSCYPTNLQAGQDQTQTSQKEIGTFFFDNHFFMFNYTILGLVKIIRYSFKWTKMHCGDEWRKCKCFWFLNFAKSFFFSGNISEELDFRLFRDCILRYFSPLMPINCYLFLWSIENNLTNL